MVYASGLIKDKALALKREKGYTIKEVKTGAEKGWRHVVSSPEPIDIFEGEAIKTLLGIEALVDSLMEWRDTGCENR